MRNPYLEAVNKLSVTPRTPALGSSNPFLDRVNSLDAPKPGTAPTLGTKPTASGNTARRLLGDPLVTALKGGTEAAQGLVGLADIPTGGRVGKFLQDSGIDFQDTIQRYDQLYTPEQQAANRAVQQADGFLPMLGALAEYPSVAGHTVLESIPAMIVGQGLGRGAMALAPKLSPLAAGAIGEGAITAGSNAEQVRAQSEGGLLTPEQAAIAAGSGALTGAITHGFGKAADKLGVGDVNQLLLPGGRKIAVTDKGVGRRIAEGAGVEAAQETAQSAQEQAATNLALGKPLGEGVGSAAALGGVTGGLLGGPVAGMQPTMTTAEYQRRLNGNSDTGAENAQQDTGTNLAPNDTGTALTQNQSATQPPLKVTPATGQPIPELQPDSGPLTKALHANAVDTQAATATNAGQTAVQDELVNAVFSTPQGQPTHESSTGDALWQIDGNLYNDADGNEVIDDYASPLTLPPGVSNEQSQPTKNEAAQEKAGAQSADRVAPEDAPKTDSYFQGKTIVEAPIDQLTLSSDVPQFKSNANKAGVTEPLGGDKYERTGTAPIQVWRRLDGRLEVISGRHRLDLARRTGETTIPAQIHDESAGFTARDAAIMDAELNIRDGQGQAVDYVNYFKASGITRPEAERRGLVARKLGKSAFAIAQGASDETLAALRNAAIKEDTARLLSELAPNDAAVQAAGLKSALDGKPDNFIANQVKALQSVRQEQGGGETTDLFDFDDSGLKQAEQMAKIATAKQNELTKLRHAARIGVKADAVQGQTGGQVSVQIRDKNQLADYISGLDQQIAAWDNWPTNPQLMAEIRQGMGSDATTVPDELSDRKKLGEKIPPNPTENSQFNQEATQDEKKFSPKAPDNAGDDSFLTPYSPPAPKQDQPASTGQNADLFTAPEDQPALQNRQQLADLQAKKDAKRNPDAPSGGDLFEQAAIQGQQDVTETDFGDRPQNIILGAKERDADARLQQLLDKIETSDDTRFFRRNEPETSAKQIIRSVVEEIRGNKDATSHVARLEQASQRLQRNFAPLAQVVDEVVEQLRGNQPADVKPKKDKKAAIIVPKNSPISDSEGGDTWWTDQDVHEGDTDIKVRIHLNQPNERLKSVTEAELKARMAEDAEFRAKHAEKPAEVKQAKTEKTDENGKSGQKRTNLTTTPGLNPENKPTIPDQNAENKPVPSTSSGRSLSEDEGAGIDEISPKDQQPNGTPFQNVPPITKDQEQFANNTIFTADKVAAARARLKAKLGTLNSGFDPELALDGLTIAGAYIESGVKTFAAYSKAMIEDFGDKIKPYLLSFYEGARAYPGLDSRGMTPADQAAKEHRALLTPAVMAQVKAAVGDKPSVKTTPKTGQARTLKADWGVSHIDGWTEIAGGRNQGSDFGLKGGLKDAFLDDAKKYLNHVASLLQADGFTPYADNKDKPIKAVSVNMSGTATSGDVSLMLRRGNFGVYITVGASTMRGINGHSHPQGVAIMARAGYVKEGKDRFVTNASNNWHSAKLSSTDLAGWVLKASEYLGLTKNADSQNQQNYVKTEPSKLEGEDNGAVQREDLPTGNQGVDSSQRQPGGATGGPVDAGLAGKGQRTAGQRGVQGSLFEPTGTGAGSASEDGGIQPPEQLGESGSVGLEPVATLSDDHVISEDLGKGGKETKFKDNIAAIKLIKQLEAENRTATLEERKVLEKYVGFGALKNVFDPKDKHYQTLKDLLTEEEFASARASMRNAHYTSRDVVNALYQALDRFGFTGGRILEPSVGSGNFIGMMPRDLRNASKIHGVELDNLTSRLAKQLYPKAVISASTNFADYKVPSGYFDVAIGNPPFGNESLVDSDRSPYSGFSIHNYFLAKMLDKTREGGILAAVVSHNFMDVISPKAREYLAKNANFLGAIRLPNTAFKQNAGTEVVTDIVFFQKASQPNDEILNKVWLESSDIYLEHPETKEAVRVRVNNYFINNPRMVLGQPSLAGSMYRDGEYTVEATGDLKTQLAEALKTLPQNLYQATEQPIIELASADVVIPAGIKEGSYFIEGDKVYRRLPDVAGETQAVLWEPANNGVNGRMRGMIGLRNALRQQLRLELSRTATEKQIEGHRQTLSKAYKAFVKEYGFLNSQTNRRVFIDDTESELVQALEADYDAGVSKAVALKNDLEERKPSAKEADILSRRVAFPPMDNVIVHNAKDALLESLNSKGRLDLAYMREVYDKPEADIIKELGDLTYQDPDSGWQMADDYLSGDVKTKLADAKTAAESDPAFRRNVEALEKIIPKDKLPSEIHAPIGAMWVPEKVYQAFVAEITGATSSSIKYSPLTATWGASISGGNTAKMVADFGTDKLDSFEIFQRLLAGKPVEVKKRVLDPATGNDRLVTDEEATEAAKAAADKIKQHWQGWLWQDGERSGELAGLFNDKYNRTVNRKFNGDHLTLPGTNPAINLFKHQKDGVWRGIQERNMLLDQVVGAGKTFQMAAIAREFKRLGIAKKPLFIVPNHLTRQWRSEFIKLYPTANVLAADPSDFEKDNRKRLFAKVTTGDFDAVVIGHSSLKKVALSPEIEANFYDEQIKEISDAIEDMKRERGDRNVIRDMEKIKANLEAKLKALKNLAGTRDDVVYFDELGVDALFIDELHEFKNLFFTTQKQRISGLGNPAGSGKAFDLFSKVRWFQDTFGERAPLITATGTPVSNSLAEMFTMQRYMRYPELRRENLHLFDAWANMFGEDEYLYEVAPSGVGYRISQRFSKFKNLGYLMGHYQSFADIITLQDLKDQAAAQDKRFPVPNIEGGRPKNVVAQRSELQTDFYGVPKLKRKEDGQPQFVIEDPAKAEITQNDSGQWVLRADGFIKTYSTEEDAKLDLVNQALTPLTEIDPKSILGQFENLRELTRKTNGKINALSLTNLANKASLDYRLIDANAPDFPGSKINKAVENMLAIYHQWTKDKGTQIVFCDLSVPLSAKAKAEAKDKRIYVKDQQGNLTHKKGTLHTMDGFEGFPFFLVKNDKTKQTDVYEPVTGQLIGSYASKTAAKESLALRLGTDQGRDRWYQLREDHPPIQLDQIAEYRDSKSLEVSEDGENEYTPDSIESIASGSSRFSVYDDIKAKLLKQGIPEKEIAFIHDYDTPAKKDDLFKRVRRGDVRFLFGSTPKLGAGTNVQERLVGLHHIDAPWRPSDLEQREGRIIRQGNELYKRDPDGFTVFIGRYATEQTYDTRRWQLLEHKAAGIEQLRKYSGEVELEDVGGEAANAADMKAAASGNPLILEETTLRNEVKKLTLLQRGHADQIHALHRKVKDLKWENAEYWPQVIADYGRILADSKPYPLPDDPKLVAELKVAGKSVKTREAAIAALTALVEDVTNPLSRGMKSIEYRGVLFTLEADSFLVKLESPTGRMDAFRHDEKISPSGLLTRFNNYLENAQGRIGHAKNQIEQNKSEIVELEAASKGEFPQKQALQDKIAQHAVVQRKLMASTQLDAVPPEERDWFKGVLAQRKDALKKAGYGEAVDEAAKFSIAPGFYSQLERAIDSLPPKLENTGAPNLKAWLLSNAAKLGVKQDELHYSGLLDWLDLQGKTKVSKAELLAYLEQSGVQVEETQKGLPPGYKSYQQLYAERTEKGKELFDMIREDQKQGLIKINGQMMFDDEIAAGLEYNEISIKDLPQKYQALAGEWLDLRDNLKAHRDIEPNTKYANYRTPGGKDGTYRELLLRLPVKPSGKYWAEEDTVVPGHPLWRIASRRESDGETVFTGRSHSRREDAERAIQELEGAKLYKSSHWQEPNIVAHIRFDERSDAEGQRVLFIQEIQSDWGQQGKKKGFRNRDGSLPKVKIVKLPEGGYTLEFEGGVRMGYYADRDAATLGLEKYGKVDGLPSAPFVTDTKAWAALAIKRAMLYAAQNGFDRIAFATGAQNADLYDLSKQISRIEYEPINDDDPAEGYDFYAYDLDGKEVYHKDGITLEEIENLVGKEIAEKIANGEGKHTGGAYRSWKELSGLDLRVGGDGMRSFYDQIIPQVANDILKKVGGGKVEGVDIASEGRWKELYNVKTNHQTKEYEVRRIEDGAIIKSFKTLGGAAAHIAKLEKQVKLDTQPGFTLTASMKAKLDEGLPLFSREKSTSGNTESAIKALLSPRQRQLLAEGKLRIVPSHPRKGAQGFYQDGVITLVADQIKDKNTLNSVLSHESWHYARENDPNVKARLQQIDQQFKAALAQARQGKGTAAEREAWRRVSKIAHTEKARQVEEFQSYLIEAWAAQPNTVGERIAKAIKDLIALIRATLIRYAGFSPSTYSVADLAALAKSSLKTETFKNFQTSGSFKNGQYGSSPGAAHVSQNSEKTLESFGAQFSMDDPEYKRQYKAIERQFWDENGHEKPGAMLAPNGERSNLNKTQWIQVRTQAFKDWFGDWEALAKQDEFDKFIEYALTENDPKGEFVIRSVTDAERNEVLKQSELDIGGMEHVLAAEWLKHAIKKHGKPNERQKERGGQRPLTKADLQNLIAVLDGYDGLTVQPGDKNHAKIIYSKTFPDGTVEYVERVIETSEKHKPRLVTKTAWVKTSAGVKSSLPRVYTPERNVNLPFQNGRVNPDSVSKVTDANGEPLVVYHGTKSDFTAFDLEKLGEASGNNGFLGEGIYATGDIDTANAYADEEGGNVMPVYVSMKNPLVINEKLSTKAAKALNDAWEIREFKHGMAMEDAKNGLSFAIEDNPDLAKILKDALNNRGYDGIIYGDYEEIVAHDPIQLNSAIGNTGAFSREDNDIRYSIADLENNASPGQAVATRPQTALQKFIQKHKLDKDSLIYNLQDRMVDLRRQVEKAVETGDEVNPYLNEELYSQRASSRIDEFYDKELNPVLEGLHQAGVGFDEFQKFLHARHAPSRNAVMAERNPNQDMIDERLQQAEADYTVAMEENDTKAMRLAAADIRKWQRAKPFKGTEAERLSLSGLSDRDAAAYLASLSPQQRRAMTALGDRIDQINASTLDLLVQYNLEKPATVEALKAQWEHYVPLYRDEAHPDTGYFSHPAGQGFSVRGSGINKATGSQAEVTNILAHIAAAREQMIRRGEKNRVSTALGGFILRNPAPEFATLGKIPVYTTLVNGLKETLPDPNYQKRDNVVMFRVKGRDIGIVFNEKNPENVRLAAALKNLDGVQLDKVESFIGRGTRWLSSINTQYNVIFGLFNFARDVQGAMLNLTTTPLDGKQGQVFKATVKALPMIMKSLRTGQLDPAYNRFLKAGGATGYMQMYDNITHRDETLRKEFAKFSEGQPMKLGRGALRMINDYNTVMEHATRMAVFETALKQGLSEAKAASLAKNITVNFNRKGAYATKIGAFYGFYNAAAQGNRRVWETLRGPKGKQVIAGGVTLGMVATFAAIAALGADDYDKIPEFVRERSLILPALWTKERYIAIPMPLGFHILPNMGRKIIEIALGSNRVSPTERWLGLAATTAGAFNPLGGGDLSSAIMPSVADPLVDIWRNQTFSGNTVYQEQFDSLNPKPYFNHAKDNTNAIAKGLSEGLNKATGGSDFQPGLINIHPEIIEYLVGQVFGGTGREILKTVNLEETLRAGESPELHKIPLLGKVYGATEGNAPERELFYQNVRKLNAHRNEYQGLRDTGQGQAATAYLGQHPEVRLIGLGKDIRARIEKLQDQRDAMKKAGLPVVEMNRLITANMKVLNDQMANQ